MAQAGKLGLYGAMLRSWWRMLVGTSYWHVTPDVGPHFVPGRLEGYVRDYRAKTRWEGPVDADGLPLCRTSDGRLAVVSTTVFQKALGEWDTWLDGERRDAARRDAFLAIARWAVASQDERGGWPPWMALGVHYASAYSAMAQGQGVSVLVRAHAATGDSAFLEAARRGAALALAPIGTGGCSRRAADGLVLEEVPLAVPNSIFNGWVYALFGLYDLTLAAADEPIEGALEETVEALVAYLPRYDAGYWSYYDALGNLASPYYHQAHIALLAGLAKAFPRHAAAFDRLRARFEKQAASRLKRLRAMCVKAIQKLRNPPDVILE